MTPRTASQPITSQPTPSDAQRPRRLPATVSFYLLASITLFFLASSSAPTPLYAVYQSEWHFSPITTTVVFGIYALAVLASLLVFGSLSDYVGRRRVLLVSVLIQAVTMLIFLNASGVPELLVARIVQGLSTGAALGAVGAGLLDLDRHRGTIANSAAPIIGTATGGIGSGLLVQYLPVPTHLVFVVLFGIFVVQAIGLAFMTETVSPRPGALASLRVDFALPSAIRRPLLVAIPALVAVWAIAGLYGALGPTLVRMLVGHNSYVLGGLALFVLAGSGALAVLALRAAAPRTLMLLGTSALIGGVGLTVIAIDLLSTALFFAGTAIAGLGFGASFQGGIRSVVSLAEAPQRAGVLSILYVVSYLAMGLPAVIAGVLVVDGGGVLDTAKQYGVVVMVLAAIALTGVARSGRRPATSEALTERCVVDGSVSAVA